MQMQQVSPQREPEPWSAPEYVRSIGVAYSWICYVWLILCQVGFSVPAGNDPTTFNDGIIWMVLLGLPLGIVGCGLVLVTLISIWRKRHLWLFESLCNVVGGLVYLALLIPSSYFAVSGYDGKTPIGGAPLVLRLAILAASDMLAVIALLKIKKRFMQRVTT